MNKRSKYLQISAVFILLLLGFGCLPEDSNSQSEAFQLIIYKEDTFSLNLKEESYEAFPVIEQLGKRDELFVLGLQDIETYDWDLQTMLLTSEATERLETAVSRTPHVSEEARFFADIDAEMGRDNPIQWGINGRPFTVKVDGETMYSGIFLDTHSTFNVDYPVIRVTLAVDKATLNFLPGQFQYALIDPIDNSGELREVQAFQDNYHELTEFEARIISVTATAEDAIQFRDRIRDDRIKTFFEPEGNFSDP